MAELTVETAQELWPFLKSWSEGAIIETRTMAGTWRPVTHIIVFYRLDESREGCKKLWRLVKMFADGEQDERFKFFKLVRKDPLKNYRISQ